MHTRESFRVAIEGIPVPDTLEQEIKSAFSRHKHVRFVWRYGVASSAVTIALAIVLLNVSPTLAYAISDVPLIGAFVRVVTLNRFENTTAGTHIAIETPVIVTAESGEEAIAESGTGQEASGIIRSLNEKYLEESKALYASLLGEVPEIEAGGGHMNAESGYIIKANDGEILSLGRYFVKSLGSTEETITYDTIDLNNQYVLTLPGLFSDNAYIERISDYIYQTMTEQMAGDDGQVYWLEDEPEYKIEGFKTIDANQSFYINADRHLVICFDKYSVAPGYMGSPEFEIPTEVISDLLVGQDYIR